MSAAFNERYSNAENVEDFWPAPDMAVLGGGRAAPATMPTELFRDAWGLVRDLADGAGAPVDYVGVSLIAIAASLIGGKRRVQPYPESAWAEPCIIWAAAVGDPSTNKSPAIDGAREPLRAMEAGHATAHEDVLRDWETRAARAGAERKQWEGQVREATKEGHDTPPMPKAAVMPEKPMRRRLIVQDITPEEMGSILTGNPYGTLHLRDELAGWVMGFERYSPGGREFWLEAYGGRPFVIDRKSAPQPLRIPFNGVSVIGGTQPEKLAECLLSGSDDGLVARFLWAWPAPVPYHRPRQVADTARLDRIYRRLDGMRTVIDPYSGEPTHITMMLEPKGADLFEAWMRDARANVGEEAASIYKSFCGKLSGLALRLALFSEMLAWADSDTPVEPTEVSLRSIAAAIGFIEDYAKPTALRVFGDAALPPVERNSASLAKYIQREKLTVFNYREHRDRCRIPALKEPENREAAIERLVEADWLKPAPQRAGSTAGRARKDYTVNPLIFKGAA